MIVPLILFIVAYLFTNGLKNKIAGTEKLKVNKKFNRTSLIQGIVYVSAVVLLSLIFEIESLHFIFLAAVLSGVIQYMINVRVIHKSVTLTQYFLFQTIQIGVIYLLLLFFGQAGTPGWMLQQFYTLMFAKQLIVDETLIIPTLLLIAVFLTSTASEIIGKFLNQFNSPVGSYLNETAASLEPILEDSLLKKRTLKRSMIADMTIEEQIEISTEGDENNPSKTKESIKLQYYWYNSADDSSKGMYIGILERLLICIFVFYEIYQGLILLGAMKTLARFKMFENKAFAEYYLIGTLLSLLAAILCGFLLQRLLIDASFY